MQKQQSYKQDAGKLYLVPTPIGNLEDMTVRCVKMLAEADVIASEDTRNTQKLLNHFDITTPQKSLHEHNYKERVPQLIALMQSGQTIAQCSDAGMPSISDPGHELVKACIAEGIAVIALPGPTAGLTALAAQQSTMIFYESPYRIGNTIDVIKEVFGDRQAVICRELTKIHEEYLRGTLSELSAYLSEQSLKGECCLLVEGADEPVQAVYEGSYLEQVEALIAEGLSSKEAIKEVAKRNQVKKQVVYNDYHAIASAD